MSADAGFLQTTNGTLQHGLLIRREWRASYSAAQLLG